MRPVLERVLVAPDKFKGSLGAAAVSEAIARAVARTWPTADIVLRPIADGGEGTVELALRHGYDPVTVEVAGPLGSTAIVTLAIRGEDAVVEVASAAGPALLGEAPTPETATRASTVGVGQLILAALDHGARRILVGAGGSCSTDGGAGAVVALGGRILDAGRAPVAPGGGGLAAAAVLDLSGLDPRALAAEIVIACDVEGVLLGRSGAAAVFGPQKGADPAAVRSLDRALGTWADLVRSCTGRDDRDEPGAGAAGGLAFGLTSVLGATMTPGADALLRLSHFDDALTGCDLVIVGEGSLDSQSLMGKGPIAIARRARARGIPVIAVVGRSLVSESDVREIGLAAVVAVAEHVGVVRSMADTADAIYEVVVRELPRLVGSLAEVLAPSADEPVSADVEATELPTPSKEFPR
jgi:glycerate kinase